MAAKANITFRKISLTGAYIRIQRLYGGKQERAWNANVEVFPNADAANPPALPKTVKVQVEGQTVDATVNRQTPVEPLESFNVTTPYDAAEMNPFKLLYPKVTEAVKQKYGVELVEDC
jgi:hypothetical protein